MADVTHRWHVKMERVKGPLRRAWLPVEPEPVLFGVHDEVAEHYKMPPHVLEPHATTLDYIVAAAAGDLRRRTRSASDRSIECPAGFRDRGRNRNRGWCSSDSPDPYETLAKGRKGRLGNRPPRARILRRSLSVYRSLKAVIAMTTELVVEPLRAS
jgi:hypothetical protein